jgi:hypothetical protein
MSRGQDPEPVHRAVRALADPVGERVGHEDALEQRLNDAAERVMHDAIPKGSALILRSVGSRTMK